MAPLHPFPAPPVRQRRLLGITLSDRCCGVALIGFNSRLCGYLASSGVLMGSASTQIELRAGGDAPSTRDRVLLVAWLVAQPEVVLLRVERAGAVCTRGGCHGQA